MDRQEIDLVSAPNKAGEAFICHLMRQGLPFAALTNNKSEKQRLERIGVSRIVIIDTASQSKWAVPQFPVGKVFLFEQSLNLCCRYIQICRSWTAKPIYVITGVSSPRLVYKGLGANYVIHSTGEDVSFLVGLKA
ncbi:hypothetical protein [Paenibacillus piri]|uniref:Uncharacterized protein n=1 Tax=Paenibacillus piri TaxID=2547395 RepID=A0A4R5KL59_9BACL|nr:hypothetical protein [Paenibacillus piri]TDF96311.1 hypothetical protein E1757_18185 [Paenibacillus piri]